MRRTLAVVIIVLALSGALAAQETNLIRNGGFEELKKADFLATLPDKTREWYAGAADSPFQSWMFGGGWDRGKYTVAVSDQAHSGKQSCEIRCEKKGRGGIAGSPFQSKPGSIIKVSFWIKAKDAIGGRIFLNFEGEPGDGWSSKELKTGTYDWRQVTRRVVVPGGKSGVERTIVVFVYTTCEGAVWIDDFSVETVDVNRIAEAPDEPAAGPKLPKAIPEPAGSIGYRVNVVSALTKVFRDDDYAPAVGGELKAQAAKNEYESMQFVIEAPWKPVTIKDVKISDLAGPGGATIPASALIWNRVEYVETTVTPPYGTDRGLGEYPDPLFPAGEFTIDRQSRSPIWITLKTPKDCPAGTYKGTVTIVADPLKPTTVPVTVTVWDFALTDETHLRTLTWLGMGVVHAFYAANWTPEGRAKAGNLGRNYTDFVLEHRLGIGGEVASVVFKDPKGKYNFAGVDQNLQNLFDKGMNCFIMGTAPNLRRTGKKEYTPEFIAQFTEMIKAYADHLREKGWLDKAYVYVYDEAPKSAWPEVKKIDKAIKEAAPEVRILQCLNEPEGVKELTGFADVFDVYVAQYHKTGVEESQKKGAEVWLAICCYPMDHPNFFVEYPLLDVRVVPWICWKYKAAGFEYWSPNAWGVNWQKKGEKWPKVPWVVNCFGRYNGDGTLIYPGDDGKPWSSIRFEALRDGFEDYEYLWTLNSLVKEADAAGKKGPAVDEAKTLLSLDEVVKESGTYELDAAKYGPYRERLAKAIVAMKALLGK